MMKKKAVALIVTSLMVVPAFAEKPAWAGNGKPTVEQREAHKKSMEGRDEVEGQRKEKLEKQEKEKEKKLKKEKKEKNERSEHMNGGEGEVDSQELKGLEKQREKKSEQMQKELGKGSEEGLESRETRRKWWKFWGE